MEFRVMTGATDASGDLTITTVDKVLGLLYAVEWIDGTFADGVDAVVSVTDTASGVDTTLLTLTDANDDAWYFPRLAECDNVGAALATYGFPLIQGTLKLVVSSGGDTLTGGAVVYFFRQ